MRIQMVVALTILAGCDAGGVGLPGSPAWQLSTTPEQRAAYFMGVCETYGFQRGSNEMAQCMQNEANGARTSASNRLDQFNQQSTFPQQQITNTRCRTYNGGMSCATF